MKAASAALMNLLASRQFHSADLYQFSLQGGGQLYYCGGDADLRWNGLTWPSGIPNGPFFDRSDNKAKCHWKAGVEVDTLVFDILPGTPSVLGEPFLSAVRQGLFDGAELTLYRAFMPTYGDTAAGTVILFVGRVTEIDAGRSLVTLSVSSHLELLNINMPRNLYQAGCINSLFDTSCGLSAGAYSVSGTVTGTASSSVCQATLAEQSGYFEMGYATFTSGACNGLTRSVKSYVQGAPGSLAFSSPFPTPPAAGDQFMLYPGCDKRQATCATKFANLKNFRGFPYIPENSTAV